MNIGWQCFELNHYYDVVCASQADDIAFPLDQISRCLIVMKRDLLQVSDQQYLIGGTIVAIHDSRTSIRLNRPSTTFANPISLGVSQIVVLTPCRRRYEACVGRLGFESRHGKKNPSHLRSRSQGPQVPRM
jgi:hypothetical protein